MSALLRLEYSHDSDFIYRNNYIEVTCRDRFYVFMPFEELSDLQHCDYLHITQLKSRIPDMVAEGHRKMDEAIERSIAKNGTFKPARNKWREQLDHEREVSKGPFMREYDRYLRERHANKAFNAQMAAIAYQCRIAAHQPHWTDAQSMGVAASPQWSLAAHPDALRQTPHP